jgi:ABC-2 type transport system ATP-binding protein
VSERAAITVEGVSKEYRLYHERNQSLKAALMRRARVRYEEFWALRDVSLEVPEGATFALIGENGSGKSTLLKCMAKILRPEKGRIETHGKISALLELGAGFHPELTGRENIFLNGSILGLSKKQLNQRFDEIVDFAGLRHFIDTPVKNYSSGMYVRLGFSVAINVDPDILLIDEVLAVGDAEFQRKCLEKFDELRSSGKTIVIVSHTLDSIRNLCDTAGWLEHGVRRATSSTSTSPSRTPTAPPTVHTARAGVRARVASRQSSSWTPRTSP